MREMDILVEEYDRNPRYTLINNQWYFKTREGDILGPYTNVEDAVQGVDCYVALIELDKDVMVA